MGKQKPREKRAGDRVTVELDDRLAVIVNGVNRKHGVGYSGVLRMALMLLGRVELDGENVGVGESDRVEDRVPGEKIDAKAVKKGLDAEVDEDEEF